MPPRFQRSRCIACGNCVHVCGKWIFRFDATKGGIYREHVQRCVHCFACQDLCPTGAIRIVLPKKTRA